MSQPIYKPINSTESNLNLVRLRIDYFKNSTSSLYKNNKYLAIGPKNYKTVRSNHKIEVLESPNFNLLPRYFSLFLKDDIYYLNSGISFISKPNITIKVLYNDTIRSIDYKVIELVNKIDNYNNTLLVNPNSDSSYNYSFKILDVLTGKTITGTDNIKGIEIVILGTTALGITSETNYGWNLLYDDIDASQNIVYSLLPVALGKLNASAQLDVSGDVVINGVSTIDTLNTKNCNVNGIVNINAIVDISGLGGKINDVSIGLAKDQSGNANFVDVSLNNLTSFGKIKGKILEVDEIKSNLTTNFINDRDLDVKGSLDFFKNINVRGNSTFKDADFNGNVSINGNSNLSGNQNIIGNSSITGDQSLLGNYNVTGGVNVTGDVNVTGLMKVTEKLTVPLLEVTQLEYKYQTTNIVKNISEDYDLDISGNLDVGNSIKGGYNKNITSHFGRTSIGYTGFDNTASFAHISHNNTTNYSLLQSSMGTTYLNAAPNRSINFLIGHKSKMKLVNGNLGIGNNNPSERLDVSGSALISGDASIIDGNLGVGKKNPNTRLDVSGSTSIFGDLTITGGKVGIGKSNPLTTLDVNGSTSISGNLSITDGKVGINKINPESTFDLSGTASILGNLKVLEGYIGIGIENPTVALDVSGSTLISGNLGVINGDVGLGNNNPSVKLDVSGSTLISGDLTVKNGKVGIGKIDPLFVLDVSGSTSILGNLSVTEGKVSIGNDNQNYDLDVSGTGHFSSDLIIRGNLNIDGSFESENFTIKDQLIELSHGTTGIPTNDAGLIFERGSLDNVFMGWDESEDKFIMATTTATGNSTGDLEFDPASLELDNLEVRGDLDISGNILVNKKIRIGNNGNFELGTDDDGRAFIRNNENSYLQFATNNLERLRIDSSGNIGIGTSNPSFKMEVDGDGYFSSNLTVGGNLNISGTTTTIDTANTTIKDQLISLATGTSGTPVNDSGIIIERGNLDNAFIGFDESLDKFVLATTTANSSSSGNLTLTPTSLVLGELEVNGSVGIGTSVSSYKLDVNGDINASGTGSFKLDGSTVIHNYNNASPNDVYADLRVIRNTLQSDGMYIGWGSSGTTAADIRFYANDTTQRMIIKADTGNVGIGTTDPKAGLQVFNDNGAIISSTVTSGTRTAILRLGSPYQSNHDAYCAKITSTNNQSSDYNSDLRFYTSEGNNASSNERMCILSNGNVGIGTDNPNLPLHVHKAAGGGKLRLTSDNTNMYLGTNDNVEGYIWVQSDHDFKIGTNDTERIRIKNSGNVGIGTATPQSKLDVEGGVAIGSTYSGTTAAPSNGMIVEGNVGIGTSSPDSNTDLHIYRNDSTNPVLRIQSGSTVQSSIQMFNSNSAVDSVQLRTSGSTFYIENYQNGGSIFLGTKDSNTFSYRMLIQSDGNIGIGTNSPAQRLDIDSGNFRTTGTIYMGTLLESLSGDIKLQPASASNNVIVNQGNLGIGTTSVVNKLDVEGAAVIGSTYSGTNTAPTNGLLVEGNLGIGTTSVVNKLDVEGAVAVGSTYSGTSTAPTNGLLVEGNVGIGTNSPSLPFEVQGNTTLTNPNASNLSNAIAKFTANDVAGVIIGSKNGNAPYIADCNGDSVNSIGIRFLTQGEERIRIDATGNVGIGTTSPQSKLDVEGGVAIGATYSGTTAAPSNGMIVEGNVGIGTNGPTAKLEVQGSLSTSIASGYYNDGGDSTTTRLSTYSTENRNISIKSEFEIACSRINVVSDKRIKTDISIPNDNDIMSDFRKLNPCKHKYIDKVIHGDEQIYGFIAQEVEEVLPKSTNRDSRFIPNIYELVGCETESMQDVGLTKITFIKEKTTKDLIEGFNDLKFIQKFENKIHVEGQDLNIECKIVEILNENEFLIDTKIKSDKIFLYGQKIDDFRSLDKNEIWALTTSALKVVDKQQMEHEEKIKKLENQMNEILKRLG